jgi:hypothetical protein
MLFEICEEEGPEIAGVRRISNRACHRNSCSEKTALPRCAEIVEQTHVTLGVTPHSGQNASRPSSPRFSFCLPPSLFHAIETRQKKEPPQRTMSTRIFGVIATLVLASPIVLRWCDGGKCPEIEGSGLQDFFRERGAGDTVRSLDVSLGSERVAVRVRARRRRWLLFRNWLLRTRAVIFDTSIPTGDGGLGTPNEDFGGPGIGSGGSKGSPGENGVALGNVLIISGDGDAADPGASATGGTLSIAFGLLGSTTYSINSVTLLNVEVGTKIVVRYRNGRAKTVESSGSGANNGIEVVPVDLDPGVVRMAINFVGPGALVDLNVGRLADVGCSCSEDADCAPDGWCRPNEQGEEECVRYQEAGETCGGFTPVWLAERCGPDLVCMTANLGIADIPGICTPFSCSDDVECAPNGWCRPTEEGDMMECVPFQGVGFRCEGFVLPWMREKCLPGLVCELSEPTGNVPGTCTLPCVKDEDCGTDRWCRSTEGGGECKLFLEAGDSCGDFVPDGTLEKCAPHLVCKLSESHVDSPGVCTPRSCADDTECAPNAWCRPIEQGDSSECVPFQGAGDTCEGYLPDWLFERCAPHLVCQKPEQEPPIADISGVCTPVACTDDAECAPNAWCRLTEQVDASECVPFQGVGKKCEGFAPAHLYERCAPDLVCVKPERWPIVDISGVCTHPCTEDVDCVPNGWCRPTQYDDPLCVSFQDVGAICGGLVAPWMLEKCWPGLECEPENPTSDAPGICTISDGSEGECPDPNSFDRVCVWYFDQCEDDSQCENDKICCLVAGCGKECMLDIKE